MYQSMACNFETLNEGKKEESWLFGPITRVTISLRSASTTPINFQTVVESPF